VFSLLLYRRREHTSRVLDEVVRCPCCHYRNGLRWSVNKRKKYSASLSLFLIDCHLDLLILCISERAGKYQLFLSSRQTSRTLNMENMLTFRTADKNRLPYRARLENTSYAICMAQISPPPLAFFTHRLFHEQPVFCLTLSQILDLSTRLFRTSP
jgi:hypothetical protein